MSDTKFLLDENIPKLAKNFLESKGHSAEYASKGTKNSELAYLALVRKCVLVSRDHDFDNPVLFPPKQFSGIIILSIHPPKAEKLIKGLDLLLSKVKEFDGKLFVVEEKEFEVFPRTE